MRKRRVYTYNFFLFLILFYFFLTYFLFLFLFLSQKLLKHSGPIKSSFLMSRLLLESLYVWRMFSNFPVKSKQHPDIKTETEYVCYVITKNCHLNTLNIKYLHAVHVVIILMFHAARLFIMQMKIMTWWKSYQGQFKKSKLKHLTSTPRGRYDKSS